MHQYSKASAAVVDALITNGAIKATKYLSEKEVIKATRVRFKKKIDKRSKIIQVALTIGAPNYLERKFIKMLKKAEEPFPVKKVQLQMPKEGK